MNMPRGTRPFRQARLRAWLLCAALGTASVRAAGLQVQVQQIVPGKGNLVVALYDKAQDFPHPGKGLAAKTEPASAESATLSFDGLAPGRYAVAAYQDANGNGKLDKNLFGAPTEIYGFSNDARGSMGPPSFDAAAVQVPAAATVVIRLH